MQIYLAVRVIRASGHLHQRCTELVAPHLTTSDI